ncbi:MAG: porin, partial [Candidatus Methylopumilus sp.]
MNKNIKLAVAGAVLALSASANAGIIIPAGEWTMDINGNVNAFANITKGKGTDTTAATVGGLATAS